MGSLLTLDNPVFRSYLFYASLLGLKMLCMSFLTSRQRFRKGAFSSPEDAKWLSQKVKPDDDVERVRRAHQNDLENIPVFLISAGLYVLTNPCPTLAVNLFRIFTAARFIHTLVYAVYPIRQPTRAIAFGVGIATTIYMIIQNVMFTL